MSEFEKYPVSRYLVIGNGNDWHVMEQFGSYRMLKKVFKTSTAAEKRAQAMENADRAKR